MTKSNLPTSLGLSAAISIVVGCLIGSGIFMKPATMASQVGSPEILIAVWIGAGIITLFGAMSNAEVAAMFPETGGQYIFFRHMYGDFFAFLYGWSAFAVFNTAGVASIAYVMGTYLEYFISLPRLPVESERVIDLYLPYIGHIYPLQNIGVKGATIAVVLALTFLNYRSTILGGRFLVFLTSLKVVAILVVIVALFFSPTGELSNFVTDSSTISLTGWALVGGIIAATSGAFWGYDGWNTISFVGGEIKNPQVAIPRALLIGITLCITIYTLINLAFLYVLPIDAMAASSMVATDAMQVAFGILAASLVAGLILLTTFGAVHGNALSVARVTFAMSAEGSFFKSIGKVHPRFQTPGNALWLHGVWTSLLVLSGTFDTLTDMVIFSSWFFYGMSTLGTMILRKKMPKAERPYKVMGYPYVPIVFIVFTFFFLVLTVVNDVNNYLTGRTAIINSVFSILLMLIGVPLYYYFRKRKNDE